MKTDTKNNRYKHHRMRLVKSRARELMLAGENHLLLIFSLLIIGTTAIIPQLIFGIIYAFYPYLIVDIACVVFTALLIAPLVYGVLRLVWRSANGENALSPIFLRRFTRLRIISDPFCFCFGHCL